MTTYLLVLCIFSQTIYFRSRAGVVSTQLNATGLFQEATDIVEPIESIMNVYQANHGYESLLRDKNICSRQFLIGDWSCHQIARSTLGFLRVLEDAVLSNQTFLAKFCEENINASECTITPKKWIPTVANIVSVLEKNGCTQRVQELSPFLDVTSHAPSNHSDGTIGSLNSTTATISPNSTSWRQAGKALGIYGPDARYGALFQSCFDYHESVVRSSDQVLKSSLIINGMGRDKAFLIGIHARHSTEMISSGYTKYIEEKDCIRHVLQDTRPKFGDRYCILVVSTDRNHTLVGLSTFAHSVGCEVLNAKEKKDTELSRNDGFAITADLHLLSQVDYFLGSTQGEQSIRTPFSSLVASIVAYNHRGTDNILWVPSDVCDKDTVAKFPLNVSLILGANKATTVINSSHTCHPSFLTEYEGRAIKGTRGKEVFLVKNW